MSLRFLLCSLGFLPAGVPAQDLVYRLPYATPPHAIGDYDGDGRDDVATFRASGELVVLSGRDATPVASFPPSGSEHPVVVADLGGARGWVVFHSTGLWTAGTIRVRHPSGHLLYGVEIPPDAVTFGLSATVVGDWNGDGTSDFVVADANAQVPAGFGRLHVYSGADGAPLGTINPTFQSIYFATDVAAMPDVDGDGRPDLVVGQRGRVDLIAGGTGQHLRQLGGTDVRNWFGVRVTVVPDVDGDGLADVAASAYQARGDRYVQLLSSRSGDVLHTFRAAPEAMFGGAIAGLPDIDGDGAGELVVGAAQIGSPAGAVGPGYVRVLSGRSGDALFTLHGSEIGEGFGYGVGHAGDVNGDGVPELSVGSFVASSTLVFSGRRLALVADRHAVAAGTGGTLRLTVQPGAAHAGRPFLVLGSASGTEPGTRLDPLRLPLNVDAYTLLTLDLANGAVFQGTFGLLDAHGTAEAVIALPAIPAAAGLRLAHAAVIADAGLRSLVLATNAVPLTMQ